MPLTTCFSCGLAFSHVESSCPHCARRTKGGVQRIQEAVHDSVGHRRVAMVASLVIPGTGQIYRCRNVEGVAWFVVTALGYFSNIALGAAVHALCVWHAGSASAPARSATSRGLIKPITRPLF